MVVATPRVEVDEIVHLHRSNLILSVEDDPLSFSWFRIIHFALAMVFAV